MLGVHEPSRLSGRANPTGNHPRPSPSGPGGPPEGDLRRLHLGTSTLSFSIVVGDRSVVKIYTKTGDDGTTGLLFGGRVRKDSAVMEINGAVDEAQAMMGMARAEAVPDSELDRLLTRLERDLWVLMAEVATDESNRPKLEAGKSLVTAEMVGALEANVDDLIARFDMPADFTIPGANRVSAALDVARTVVRRAERAYVSSPLVDSYVGLYLNRLSDLLVGDGPLDRGRAPCPGPEHTAPRRWPEGRRGSRRKPDVNIEVLPADSLPPDVVAVGVPVLSADGGPRLIAGSDALADLAPAVLDPEWCRRHGFGGKVAQTVTFRAATGDHRSGPEIVLVGVGPSELLAGDRGLESLRRAAAGFVRAVGQGERAAFLLPPGTDLDPGRSADAVAEGAVLASYRYDAFRTGDTPGQLSTLIIVTGTADEAPAVRDGAARGARLAASVGLARDLVNEPPSSLTPEKFADTFVERFSGVAEVTVEVWDEERIAAERLGGLLGVARGSTQPPRLVRVEYRPADPIEIGGRVPHLALVGKGITFDSGGLSLKTATGMETMKTDMGGAAAVLSAVDAAAALGARIRITAITPLTENMPGGSAIKPGDVLTTRSGKTIEVLNTDAEGRLVLADGLTLAVESEPDAIVDLATLTGAAVVALGKEIGGLLGNDDALTAELRAAGERAGEPLWPLPLPDDYRGHIESEIADMRNVGRPGQAGTISAAMLLREFVADVPWAHLDIAGPARSDENTRYLTKGGTGFGVRTLVELVTSEHFAESLVPPAR